jgi:hypothetical protein|tara:strand:+ start:2797 stop:2976 length:180 start_codon:yes stop_codon:yes gene_type:complete
MMDIKRTANRKPDFCGEKKPSVSKKKKVAVNKIRQDTYVSESQGKAGYIIEDHNVRSDS